MSNVSKKIRECQSNTIFRQAWSLASIRYMGVAWEVITIDLRAPKLKVKRVAYVPLGQVLWRNMPHGLGRTSQVFPTRGHVTTSPSRRVSTKQT